MTHKPPHTAFSNISQFAFRSKQMGPGPDVVSQPPLAILQLILKALGVSQNQGGIMRLKLISLICAAWTSTIAFAGHPASDRVVDILEEGFRIVDYSESAQPRALCSLIQKYLERETIANRLLGSYLRSSDTAGVQAFRREVASFMVTEALPKLKDLKGKTGTYSVGQNPSRRSDGAFSVPVNIRTGSKSYNGRAIVSANMKFQDIEYLGFSGVSYIARDIKKKLDGHARTSSTPVTAFVNNMRSQKDYVRCR